MNWFNYYICQKRYTIKDLHIPRRALTRTDRNMVKVLIIDDEPFVYETNLHRLGYSIQKYDDLPSLEAAEAFQIIISDVKGVGKQFGSPHEGAFLLKQLKKRYPMKEYGVYTGNTFSLEINTYLDGITIIKKDNPCDEWCDVIDSLIRKVTDPEIIWRKILTKLINSEIPLKTLSKLEHEYVETILDKDGDFSKFPSKNYSSDFSQDARSIAQSLVAGLILLPF